MKRRKFTSKFKTKVVLEALKERKTMAELAKQYELHPGQIAKWKSDFLDRAETVFEKGGDIRSEAEKRESKLLEIIGQQKVDIDFLRDALR